MHILLLQIKIKHNFNKLLIKTNFKIMAIYKFQSIHLNSHKIKISNLQILSTLQIHKYSSNLNIMKIKVYKAINT